MLAIILATAWLTTNFQTVFGVVALIYIVVKLRRRRRWRAAVRATAIQAAWKEAFMAEAARRPPAERKAEPDVIELRPVGGGRWAA